MLCSLLDYCNPFDELQASVWIALSLGSFQDFPVLQDWAKCYAYISYTLYCNCLNVTVSSIKWLQVNSIAYV